MDGEVGQVANANESAVCVLAGIGLAALIYYAYSQTDDVVVPDSQKEGQMMGLGIQDDEKLVAGTPLDMSQHYHGWHPGYDPDPTGQPVTQSKHRYPAVPGGNISNVMHLGWKGCAMRAPAGNDWFTTPPEAAVI